MIPFALLATLSAQTPESPVPLADLDLNLVVQDWGAPRKNLSVDGNPLRIAGRTYLSGLGTHANSTVVIDLKRKALSFQAQVGVDDEVGTRGSVVFTALVDGKTVYTSPVLRGGDAPQAVTLDLRGAARLELVVLDGEDGIDFDHANWAEAVLKMEAGATPSLVSQPVERALPIASHRTQITEINGPRVVGSTPGHEVIFRIPASGPRPMIFQAEGLPQGLTLDPNLGIIRGRITQPGKHPVTVTATGRGGTSSRTITFLVGHRKLAQTPPMGWNSWNVWGLSISQDKVEAAAQAMLDSRLADFGYQYVNIDDGWQGKRDAQGVLQPNEKFGDMKELSARVHAMGLKLGIYSSPGPLTCGGYIGSYQHELIDAKTWAEWGIDFLKHDWCSYSQIAEDDSRYELQKPYRLMRQALDAVDRDIVYSLCQYGMGNVWEWGHEVGADLWRTTGDITDTWGSLSSIGFAEIDKVDRIGPSSWNDPDMLVVGKVGWGPNPRPNRLTSNEQIVHMTIWAMVASPLLIGGDMTQMDEFTKDLLMNRDVIEVNQDHVGHAPKRVWREGSLEVWTRKLWDGTTAVALFNRGLGQRELRVSWQELGVEGPFLVRDLWQRRDIGSVQSGLRYRMPRRSARLLRVGRMLQ